MRMRFTPTFCLKSQYEFERSFFFSSMRFRVEVGRLEMMRQSKQRSHENNPSGDPVERILSTEQVTVAPLSAGLLMDKHLK